MRITVAAAVAYLAVVGLSVAADAQASIKKDISIPAGGLGAALQVLSEERRIHVVFISEDVNKLLTQGASGSLTVDEALNELLDGTDLTFQYIDDETVSIVPVKTGGRSRSRTTAKTSAVKMAGMTLARNAVNTGKIDEENEGTEAAPNKNDGSSKASTGAKESIEEVIVTAERRQADLQSTPVAVSVRQGSELQQQGKFSTEQILEDVPSVAILSTPIINNNDSPANRIVIRGIMSNAPLSGDMASQVPAAAYYVDGVLNGVGGNYEIDNVQALRGPQGTLYGRSATAGAVLVNTIAPKLGEFGGNAAVEVGNFALQHYTGAINLPAGDMFAVRVSANKYKRDGWYAREGGQIDTDDARVKLLFKPNDDLSVLLGYALQNNDQYSGELNGRLSGSGTEDVIYDIPAPLGTGYAKTRQYWAQVDWDLGAATLTYLPALRDYEQDATVYTNTPSGQQFTNQIRIPRDSFHTQELRLASNSPGPWQWQTGAFYYRNDMSVQSSGLIISAQFPSPGYVLYDNNPERRLTENYGIFAESIYAFSNSTRLTAGLRGDYTKVVTREVSCSGPAEQPLTNCVELAGSDGIRIWRNLTYKLRGEHDLTPSNLVYASISSAFLPGDVGVTTGAEGLPVAAPYEAETLTAFEVGSKNRFLDNTLQINGAVYYYRYGGRQVPVTIGQFGGVPLTEVMSNPARMVGAELEGIFQPTSRDRFGLNVSYTNAYYVDKSAAFAASVANSHLAGVIPWQVSPSYEHMFSLPRSQTLTFRAQAVYRSSYLAYDITQSFLDAGMEPYVTNGGTLQGNLSMAYAFLPQASVSAYVRNVSNSAYKIFLGALESTIPTENQARLSEPRTYGIVLNVRF